MIVGTVRSLHRYPLKSAAGESPGRAEIGAAGVRGDRVCAVLDRATALIASAKRPARWRALLRLAARFDEDTGAVSVAFPDGRRYDAGTEAADRALSEYLQRPVRVVRERREDMRFERSRPDQLLKRGLDAEVAMDVGTIGAAAPEGGFHDFAPVHLVALASLSAVASAAGARGPAPERFRPNLVVDGADLAAYAENRWAGRRMRIGGAELEIMVPTPRCAVPALAHGPDQEADPAVLRAVQHANRVGISGVGTLPCLGAYAKVVRPGTVAVGDPVRIG